MPSSKEKKEKKSKKSGRSSRSKDHSPNSKSEKDKKTELGRSEKESKKSHMTKSREGSPLGFSQIQEENDSIAKSQGVGAQKSVLFDPQATFAPVQNQEHYCTLHHKPLNFYCESCEELICYDCTVMGPHNTQLHRISSIVDAFKYRFQSVNKTIHEGLVPKRAQLIGQIVRLDHRLEEVKTASSAIERDIRNEYAGIMERLKSAEGVKNAVLQHDMAEVQKDIIRLDEILMFMEKVATGGQKGPIDVARQNDGDQFQEQVGQQPDQIGFLLGYRQLNEKLQHSITKQFKVEIDTVPNDLPRELEERSVLMDHYEQQRKLLKFKDEVIWNMSQELKKKYDFYQEEFDRETRHEMNEWARLVDLYSAELKKYEMVCAFCGVHVSESNINADCVENSKLNESQMPTVFLTAQQPDSKVIGKGRHWFARPHQNIGFQKHLETFKSPQTFKSVHPPYNDKMVIPLKTEGFLQKNPQLQTHVQKLHTQLQKGTDYADMTFNLKSADPTNSGFCSHDDFFNSVFNAVKGLKPSELVLLLRTFGEAYSDRVNYEDFLRLIEGHGAVRNSVDYGMARMTVHQSPPRGQVGSTAKQRLIDTLHANEERSNQLESSLERKMRHLSPGTDQTQLRRPDLSSYTVKDNQHLQVAQQQSDEAYTQNARSWHHITSQQQRN